MKLRYPTVGETHDSIEDARGALALYKKYLELDAKGEVTTTLQRLVYEYGRTVDFKYDPARPISDFRG